MLTKFQLNQTTFKISFSNEPFRSKWVIFICRRDSLEKWKLLEVLYKSNSKSVKIRFVNLMKIDLTTFIGS